MRPKADGNVKHNVNFEFLNTFGFEWVVNFTFWTNNVLPIKLKRWTFVLSVGY